MSKAKDALFPQTERFAERLQTLLNRTVCDFAKVDGRILPIGSQSIVGTNLEDFTSRPVRLRSLADTPLWLDVSAYLMLDEDEGQFLTVRSSVCALLVSDPPEDVLHYDYQREKERYTEAHVQVHARHTALEQLLGELGRKEVDALAKIHLPVGGRRFRPALEDLLECLIDEGVVEPHDGWYEELQNSRLEYRFKQVAAAVRRNQGTAIRELERLGYTVAAPTESRRKAIIRRLLGPSGSPANDDSRPKGRPRR
ncbi:hypothetical protein ABZS66_43715 [Dactylosporangium sp. NPDC005572]|uniref:hypothetical protein n=1 Tax=Dactylosporangium sp. NPDC005572 TaxID=3156889 RepID=UPI0033ADD813